MKLLKPNGLTQQENRTVDYKDNEYDRQTGRSTARRLLALGYACLAPGTTVEFKDHMPNTVCQAKRHLNILKAYISKLDLPVTATRTGTRIHIVVTPSSCMTKENKQDE